MSRSFFTLVFVAWGSRSLEGVQGVSRVLTYLLLTFRCPPELSLTLTIEVGANVASCPWKIGVLIHIAVDGKLWAMLLRFSITQWNPAPT